MNTLKINFKNIKIKKICYYSLSTAIIFYMVLVFTFLTSCSKDDTPLPQEDNKAVIENEKEEEKEVVLPTINLISGETKMIKGVIGAPGIGSLQNKVAAKAPEGFSKLIIYKIVDGIKSEYQTIDTKAPNYIANSNTYTYDLGYTFTDKDADKDIYFKAEIVDVLNNSKTLKLGGATVKKPIKLIKSLSLKTINPFDPKNLDLMQYLKIDNEEISSVGLGKVIDEKINDKIALIISYNKVDGLSFSSANAVKNQASVLNIENKSTTKLKKLSGKIADLSLFNIYDTYKIEDLYNNASFGENQETVNLLKENDIFAFRTDNNNRTGLVKVVVLDEINANEYWAVISMHITQ